MDEFLKVFGEVRVATVTIVIVAILFVYKVYAKIKETMIEQYKRNEEKEERIQAILDQASRYPEWHQQSLDIQKQFSDAITELKSGIQENSNLIREMEAMRCLNSVLTFSDELLHSSNRHSKERFDQIIKDAKQYELYCEEHPNFENDRAVFAIGNIRSVYQKCLEEGTFL